jgi:hypothetical protein
LGLKRLVFKDFYEFSKNVQEFQEFFRQFAEGRLDTFKKRG